MSQENVALVRAVYDAWARGEFPGPADLLDPQIDYVNPPGAVEPGTRHGLAAFARAVDKVFEGWQRCRASRALRVVPRRRGRLEGPRVGMPTRLG
jgi:hypothetical protein